MYICSSSRFYVLVFQIYLKGTNLCMFSRCIASSSLTICSWHDMTLSQLVTEEILNGKLHFLCSTFCTVNVCYLQVLAMYKYLLS